MSYLTLMIADLIMGFFLLGLGAYNIQLWIKDHGPLNLIGGSTSFGGSAVCFILGVINLQRHERMGQFGV